MIVAGAVVVALWKPRQHPGGSATEKMAPDVRRLSAVGEPIDWSARASTVAEIPGRVHCFSLIQNRTARLVWGTPRRAEDLDLATGRRRPVAWLPEVYRFGCPALSPDGTTLLFTAPNKAGAMEIRSSVAGDGGSATSLTSGFDPVWLGGSDGFVYSVDNSHAAIFSLSTMTSTFLPSPSFGQHDGIAAKAVNRAGTAVAELVYDDKAAAIAAVLSGNLFEETSAFSVPSGSSVQFSDRDGELLIMLPGTSTGGGVLSVDWRRGRAVDVGRYPGFEFGAIRLGDRGEVALVRRRTKDVWLRGHGAGKRLTFDGQNYTAAMSLAGVLLMSKRSDSGVFSIWQQTADGRLSRLTEGPDDVEPSFSGDGKQWAYADYAQMSIMLCSTELGSCRVLRRDGLLPSRPTFSPDGQLIAYVTQLNRPQVTLVSTKDGVVRASWDAHPECAPAWSSAATVWSLESSNGQYVWSERNLAGKKTGNQIVGSNESLEAGEVRCSPKNATVESSPWFRRVDVENVDNSKILIGSFR